VLIHQGLHCSCSSNRDKPRRPICVQFFGSAGLRFRGFILLCENHASCAATRRIQRPLRLACRSSWTEAEIRVERFLAHHFRPGPADGRNALDGTKLSKACPVLKPF